MVNNIGIRKRLKGWDIKRTGWFIFVGGVCFSLWGMVMMACSLIGVGDARVIAAFFFSGAVSGGLLAVLLRRSRKQAGLMALLGGIGALSYIVWLIIIGIAAGGFERSGSWPASLLVYVMWGATIGALLGVAFKNRRVVIGLALAGAIGFPLGMWLASWLQLLIFQHTEWLEYHDGAFVLWLRYGFTGMIGGAFIGAALSFFERKKNPATGTRRVLKKKVSHCIVSLRSNRQIRRRRRHCPFGQGNHHAPALLFLNPLPQPCV